MRRSTSSFPVTSLHPKSWTICSAPSAAPASRWSIPKSRTATRSSRARKAKQSDLDLTPGALDKTNDPVRMYLREMGTVPLLTREGEVAIAKRIEQGKLAVIKSISRTPKVTQDVLELGEQLKRGERTVRELVVFNEEGITDEKIAARQRELVKQIDRVKLALGRRGQARREVRTRSRGPTSASSARRAGRSDAPASSCRARFAGSSSPRW